MAEFQFKGQTELLDILKRTSLIVHKEVFFNNKTIIQGHNLEGGML